MQLQPWHLISLLQNPKYCCLKLLHLVLFFAAISKAGKLLSTFFACLCSAYGLLLHSGLVRFYVWCRCQNTAALSGLLWVFIWSHLHECKCETAICISLSPFQVNGDIPPRLKKSAHEIILDFIRSRPPLNPVCNPVGFIPNKIGAF